MQVGFIEQHGLWSDEQRARAQALKQRLERGYNINVATTLLAELRAGESRQLAAWCAHRLAHGKIEAKQVNLLERDQSLRNPSILL
jgi:hypothetical protein